MTDEPEFELTLRLRNNLLKRRRRELGLKPRELAKSIGISYWKYLEYEGLKTSPLRSGKTRGESPWRPSALAIADFYCCSPTELWPTAILSVTTPKVVREMDAKKLMAAMSVQPAELPSPEQCVGDAEMVAAVGSMLEQLEPREAKVLRLRFGIGPDGDDPMTLSEIGKHISLERHPGHAVGPERVRQIESRALGKIRRVCLSKPLRDFVKPLASEESCASCKHFQEKQNAWGFRQGFCLVGAMYAPSTEDWCPRHVRLDTSQEAG
jgi:hypothetical protein